jgi:hypothetical protein
MLATLTGQTLTKVEQRLVDMMGKDSEGGTTVQEMG